MKFYYFDKKLLKSLNLPHDKKYTLDFITRNFMNLLSKVKLNDSSLNFEKDRSLIMEKLKKSIIYQNDNSNNSNIYFDYGYNVTSINI